MILTCPECATSYFVDDARVPAAGRSVKCSSCGAKWTAVPEGAAPPAPKAAPTPAPAPVAPAPVAPPDDIVVEAAPEPAEEPALRPRPARARAEPKPEPKRSGAPAMAWVAAAAVLVGLAGGLIVMRSEVARMVPSTRAVYAAIGIPANPLGLVIEGVHVDPAFQGGRPVLAVSGVIRNVRRDATLAPSLRVNLLDQKGVPLAAKLARPIDGRVPAGAIRHFAIAIVDPPASVHDLQVTFDETKAPVVKAAAPRAAEARLAGPAPIDAKPLPPDSPDALPQHD